MKSKILEKEKAIRFRKLGYSYSEIIERVPVTKSTLSVWLRPFILSERQQHRLREKKLAAMKKGWKKNHQNRLDLIEQIKNKSSKEVRRISKKQRLVAGIMLYWAEGSKEKETKSTNIRFSNSDPDMIKIFIKWLAEFFSKKTEELIFELYIHRKTNWKRAKSYWSSKIGISEKNIRVYFKRHNPKPKRKNINEGYNGLIRIIVPRSTNLVRKINGWIFGVKKRWGVVEW